MHMQGEPHIYLCELLNLHIARRERWERITFGIHSFNSAQKGTHIVRRDAKQLRAVICTFICYMCSGRTLGHFAMFMGGYDMVYFPFFDLFLKVGNV